MSCTIANWKIPKEKGPHETSTCQSMTCGVLDGAPLRREVRNRVAGTGRVRVKEHE